MSLPIPSLGSGTTSIDPKEQEAIDNILVALASRSNGDLRKLLHSFFSFLHRRTDFYIVPHEDDVHSKMGFREGDAEKVLLAAFRQFPLRKMPRQADIEAAKKTLLSKTTVTSDPPSNENSIEESKPKQTRKIEDDNELQLTEKGLQMPVGNGGTTAKYKWTQTIDECTVMIQVPAGIRGKELDVSITSSAIEVKPKKPLDDGTDLFVKGPLTESIDPSESTWSLEGGVVVLVLYKKQKKFWETILVGDSKIDTSMVDSRRNISEYDETTQAQIRKMIFDQNQVQRGLPTSDEIAGIKPPIPPLPPGVEYINQEKLDEAFKSDTPNKK
jgi:hypothetical protein